ncbi:MAG: hypothetical protein Q9219_004332 [cf. Caloplaca sp. 3 TL-2023]
MSRAYREARGDLIWIIDCNVWVDRSVTARLVDLLCGFTPNSHGYKYKFVHQLPLAIDISQYHDIDSSSNTPLFDGHTASRPTRSSASALSSLGGYLEEMFLSTSHAKFYTAIAAVAVAPCTVGKSTMFRRSHLNALTASDSNRDPGIDFFSENICEDHLIGDLLWKRAVPVDVSDLAAKEGLETSSSQPNPTSPVRWKNHGLLSHSLVIQPTHHFSCQSYLARRTRWLRVRKFTVALATLVEPGTESLLCSAYGAYGLTTLSWCNKSLGTPRTWTAFFTLWVVGIMLWCAVDTWVYKLLQTSEALKAYEDTPVWVKHKRKRRWEDWLLSWLGRELFAFPIWLWAVMGGVTVVWRGRRFWVGMDMKVHEIDAKGTESKEDMGVGPSTEWSGHRSALRGGAAERYKGRVD